jgi:hypothetical protein
MNKIFKEIVLSVWEDLGTAPKRTIAETTALSIIEMDWDNILKARLLRHMGSLGWTLNSLAKEGYGYNTGGDKHSDRDNAGLLNEHNKKAVWVFDYE